MGTRRWVIIAVGAVVTVGLVVTAVIFGLRGIEVASWIAGIAGLVVAVAATVLAVPSSPAPPPPPVTPPPVTASGERSIAIGGANTGIASTGDNATNTQRR